MRNRRWEPALVLLLVGAYFVAGKLGLRLAFVNVSTTVVWAPTGIALSALLLLGIHYWPAVLVAAFLVNITTGGSLLVSSGIAIGNTLEAVVGAQLVLRYAGGAHALEQPKGVFLFTLLGAGLSTFVSATIGTLSLVLGGAAAWHDATAIHATWWLGDAGGDLVVAPLILLWSARLGAPVTLRRGLEVAGLLTATVLASQASFGGIVPGAETLPLAFLCTPIFIWAAFRFGQRTSAIVVALVYAIAVRGTLAGVGSFWLGEPNRSLLLLQAFVCVSSVTTLTLAALVSQRRASESKLRHLAVSDPLTGLANYRHLLDVLSRELQRVDRTARPFAVVFLDLNGLKKINDVHGHLVGSRALWRVAEALRHTCRSIDTPARYGGDEFAVVLPEAGEEAAELVVRRVTELLAADPEQPPVSISSGVALCPRDGVTVAELLAVADRAQYATKHPSSRVTDGARH